VSIATSFPPWVGTHGLRIFHPSGVLFGDIPKLQVRYSILLKTGDSQILCVILHETLRGSLCNFSASLRVKLTCVTPVCLTEAGFLEQKHAPQAGIATSSSPWVGTHGLRIFHPYGVLFGDIPELQVRYSILRKTGDNQILCVILRVTLRGSLCNFSASLRVKLTCVTFFGTKTQPQVSIATSFPPQVCTPWLPDGTTLSDYLKLPSSNQDIIHTPPAPQLISVSPRPSAIGVR
jgi:hypothetical protein